MNLEMNIHVMSLIDLLKIGGTGLDFKITIGRTMEEMAMTAKIEMPLIGMPLREIFFIGRIMEEMAMMAKIEMPLRENHYG